MSNVSDELPAAVARMREYERVADAGEGLLEWEGQSDDIMDIVYAYLAEHHADDGELVTEEWLRSVGAKDEPNGRLNDAVQYGLFIGPAQWFDFPAGCELLIDHHRGEWRLRTRGDVRRLCKALDVQLKESAI